MNKEQEIGPRHNLGFEGVSFAPDGRSVWLAMESALYQDGPIATPSTGAIARLTRFDRDRKMLGRSSPIRSTRSRPVPTGKNGDNGISEILALDDTHALVLERSGVEGADGVWKMYIRIYAIDTAGATDIAAVPSLASANYIPVAKRLVIDLAKTADIGPGRQHRRHVVGADTRRTASAAWCWSRTTTSIRTQVTQFLAFEITP
jgi:hypothetical protein